MIPGTVIKIGGKDYLVPPLNATAMILHKEFLKKVTMGTIDPETAAEQFEPITELIFLAVKRNYPEVTLDAMREDLDLGNMDAAFAAVMKRSGFVEKVPASGEA